MMWTSKHPATRPVTLDQGTKMQKRERETNCTSVRFGFCTERSNRNRFISPTMAETSALTSTLDNLRNSNGEIVSKMRLFRTISSKVWRCKKRLAIYSIEREALPAEKYLSVFIANSSLLYCVWCIYIYFLVSNSTLSVKKDYIVHLLPSTHDTSLSCSMHVYLIGIQSKN